MDLASFRSYIHNVLKVKSFTIDMRRVANGMIPEPVFLGELSRLSPADPEDEEQWVGKLTSLIWEPSIELPHLKGVCRIEHAVQFRVYRLRLFYFGDLRIIMQVMATGTVDIYNLQ